MFLFSDIANAIRNKTNTSVPIKADDFPARINSIGPDYTVANKIIDGTITSIKNTACTTIGDRAFYGCISLTTVNFPVCTTIRSYAFCNCSYLTTASFPACTSIGYYAFSNCRRLISLYLLGSSIPSLAASNAFGLTPIGGTSAYAGQYGSIYVPASLLASYQAATNWSLFSSRFVGV